MRRHFLAPGGGARAARRRARGSGVERLEDRRLLAVLTVNTVSDSDNPAAATLSLREAIEVSNGTLAVSALSMSAQQQVTGTLATPNKIDFAIFGSVLQTIQPATDLPTITAPVIIDGYSQTGASANGNPVTQADNAVLLIAIDGSLDNTANMGNGLTISAGGSTVRGLVIDNFADNGVVLTGTGGDDVAGNFIGTNPAGSAASPNGSVGGFGVLIDSPNATIGGTDPADRNVISGNGGTHSGGGIGLNPTSAPSTSAAAAVIEGNFIGTDATGTQALGHQLDGIVSNAANTTIGGTAQAAGNVISGNAGDGIDIGLSALIQGNLIGTDLTGKAAVANGNNGMQVEGENTTIGGTDPGAGNIISANGSNGIYLIDATGILVQGNIIGSDATGTIDLGNSGAGILAGVTTGTTIGGSTAAAGNTIAFTKVLSGGDGQGVSEFGSGVLLLDNAIYGNQAAGIAAAGGVAPVLSSATTATIVGMLTGGAASSTYHLEFFATPNTGGATDNAQGKTFLAAQDVATDGTGAASFTVSPAGGVPAGEFITATATDPNNNTSAFSSAVTTSVGGLVDLNVTAAVNSGPVAVGSELDYSFTVANQGPGMATGVVLSHMLPANVNFVSAHASQGTATQAAGLVTASLGTILGGANATVELAVIPQGIGPVMLVAQLTADEGLLHPMQGSTTLPISVLAPPPINVAATVATGSTPLSVTWSYTNTPGVTTTFNIYRSESPGAEGATALATGLTTDQYTDAGAVPGHVYYYQVTAVTVGLESRRSAEAVGSILTAPAPTPLNLGLLPDGTTAVFVNWNYPAAVGAAVTFNVYQSATPGGEGATPYKMGVKENPYNANNFAGAAEITSLPASTAYYEVSAVVAGHEGPRSSEIEAAVPPLTAPVLEYTGVGYDDAGEVQVVISWTDPEPAATALDYNLYALATPDAKATPANLLFSGNRNSFNSFVLPGQPAYFTVAAVVNSYQGPLSTVVQITSQTLGTTYLAGNVQIELFSGKNEPRLLITSPIGVEAVGLKFNVYRGTIPGGEGTVPYDTGALAYAFGTFPTAYFDANAVPGVTYYYQVAPTVDGIVAGPPSNEVELTVPRPKLTVTGITKINVTTFSGHHQTALALTVDFSGALNAGDAASLAAYHLVTLGKLNKKTGQHATKPVKVTSAVYNAAQNTVTLAIKGKLPTQPLELSVNTSSVLDASGQPIAGNSGQAGGSFQTTFGKKGITLPSVSAAGVGRRVSAQAFDALADMRQLAWTLSRHHSGRPGRG